MQILIDTSVWSLALRKSSISLQHPVLIELNELIQETRACLMGPIRQELLSGIKLLTQFELLRQRLLVFPDIPIVTEHYELAAKIYNDCRNKGIQGSNTDFLICAVGIKNDIPIMTLDNDFLHFSKCCDIQFYHPRQ